MADQAALKRAFADYARTIAGSYEIGEVLYLLSDQVVEVLDIDGAGVSLAEADGTLQFVTTCVTFVLPGSAGRRAGARSRPVARAAASVRRA
jgi:hypothetical protein